MNQNTEQKIDATNRKIRRRDTRRRQKNVLHRSDTTPEKQKESKEVGLQSPTPVVVNHHYYVNSPVTYGISVGNKFNYDLPAKFYVIKEGKRDEEETRKLQENIKKMLKENEPGMTSLKDILRECDAETTFVGDGCVRVVWRFTSLEGLKKFWKMFSTGKLKQRLQEDLPIEKVTISERDFKNGCKFFARSGKINEKGFYSVGLLDDHLNFLEKAASEYVRQRTSTVQMLRGLARDYTQSKVQKRLAEVALVFFAVMVAILVTIAILNFMRSDSSNVITLTILNTTVVHVVSRCEEDFQDVQSILAYALGAIIVILIGVAMLIKTCSPGNDKVNDGVVTVSQSAKSNVASSFSLTRLLKVNVFSCAAVDAGSVFSGVAALICFIVAIFCGIISIYNYIMIATQWHRDIDACLQLQSAFFSLKVVVALIQRKWMDIAGIRVGRGIEAVLESVEQTEILKLSEMEASHSESMTGAGPSVRSDMRSSDALFSVIQVPCTLQKQIFSAENYKKIPSQYGSKFVNEFADIIDCPSEEEMKHKTDQIRFALGRK
ncbi:uncharacterized protein LOC119741356 [Patiria miniata]|uniref:Uncharacterized protein n=1 Tax=Patiria miniata TaxID=46514 RepID=A0A914BAJ6_PATMI|nr:uncharacterized protein LOC119741356 [Patiria miniata]